MYNVILGGEHKKLSLLYLMNRTFTIIIFVIVAIAIAVYFYYNPPKFESSSSSSSSTWWALEKPEDPYVTKFKTAFKAIQPYVTYKVGNGSMEEAIDQYEYTKNLDALDS